MGQTLWDNEFDPRGQELLGIVNGISGEDFINSYINNGRHYDVSIDPNANTRKTPANMVVECSKRYVKRWLFTELLNQGRELFGNSFSLDPVMRGRIYIHDSTKPWPYCIGAASSDLVFLGKEYGHLHSKPPKRLGSFISQVETYVLNLSQQFAGAVALTDLPIMMAWYSANDSEYNIGNELQSFIHTVNDTQRIGGESPFTNISVNSEAVIEDMFGEYGFPDGRTVYDFMDEIMRVQKIMVNFMTAGDPMKGGLQYRFPILTANFKPEDIDSKWARFVFEKNNRGYMNINNAQQFSSCCRLLSDISEMLKYKISSLGSGGIKVGSHRVVTVNLPAIAIDAGYDEGRFYELLDEHLERAARILYIHKTRIIKRMIDSGMLFFFKPLNYFSLSMLFSTIGIVGFPDAIEFLGGSVLESSGQKLGDKILEYIMNKAQEFTDRWGYDKVPCFFNVEEVPAESAAGTLASFDNVKEYYSNQFVPLESDVSIAVRAEIEGRYASKISGGSMTFFSLSSGMDPEQSYKLHRWVAGNTGINQFVINYGWSVCDNHLNTGHHLDCPDCGNPVSYYERVVGYLVNINSTNKVKQHEMLSRSRVDL